MRNDCSVSISEPNRSEASLQPQLLKKSVSEFRLNSTREIRMSQLRLETPSCRGHRRSIGADEESNQASARLFTKAERTLAGLARSPPPLPPRRQTAGCGHCAVLFKLGSATKAVFGVVDAAMSCGTSLVSHQMIVLPAIFCAGFSGARWREPFTPM